MLNDNNKVVQQMLTVFTPAYNRAHTIGRTYKSLCRQTCKDFEWLIIDDGSSDGTYNLVKSWIKEDNKNNSDNNPQNQQDLHELEGWCEAGFKIRYFWQENQGMHGAHNTAKHHISTELNTCIDSDDWMPDDAVKTIIDFWHNHGSSKYAGIIGLDYDSKGNLIGSLFPEDIKETTLSGFYHSGGKGDKKIVLRTKVLQEYPDYPRFDNERYFSLGYKYHLIDRDYTFLVINQPLINVDYQADGSSHSMWKQYWNNPQGFMFLRKEFMRMYTSPKIRIKSSIHYISHCIRAHRKKDFLHNPCPILSFFCIPFGFGLYLYNKHMVRAGKVMNIR